MSGILNILRGLLRDNLVRAAVLGVAAVLASRWAWAPSVEAVSAMWALLGVVLGGVAGVECVRAKARGRAQGRAEMDEAARSFLCLATPRVGCGGCGSMSTEEVLGRWGGYRERYVPRAGRVMNSDG